MRSRKARGWASVVGGISGVLLFIALVRHVGLVSVVAGARRLGSGFLIVVVLAGVRLAARAGAWTLCAGGPDRLPLTRSLGACVVGEGAGNVVPLGLAASEPAKVLWVRERLGMVDAAASLGAETLIYSVGVAVMLVAGTVAWTVTSWPSFVARWVGVALVLAGAIGVAGGLAVRRGGGIACGQRRLRQPTADARSHLAAARDALRRMGLLLRTLASQDPGRLCQVVLLQAVVQAAAVLEVWITLCLLGQTHSTVLQAFLLEYANRVVTIVFKFVPMRVGVDEFASGAMAGVIGLTDATGITVALVRKARVLCWTAVGVALASRRLLYSRVKPLSLRAARVQRDRVSS